MRVISKIVFFLVLFCSVLVQSQSEKIPSYFIDQVELNTVQLIANKEVNNEQKQLQAELNTISLKQIGNENFVRINDKASYGEHKVSQIGNKNEYQFINYKNSQQINLGVLQTGNSNSLQIKGVNSIFKNLKITQFGGAKLTMYNY